jgi:hypothetical protein
LSYVVNTVVGTPTGLQATFGNGSVALAWNAVSGAITYNVYRGTSPSGESSYATGIGTNSYTDSSATNETTYYYKVSAVNGGGEGGLSSEVNATPHAPFVGLSVSSLTFATQYVSTTSAAQTITVTNTGQFLLSISAVTITGTNANNFAFTGCGNGSSTTVAAGANCVLSVTFTPSATGSRVATLNVASDAVSTPDTASLSGTGGDPPAVSSTLTSSFYSILPGQSATLSYTTSNADISCAIDQGVSALSPCSSGTKSVSPSATTIYTLTAVGTSGSHQTNVTIIVTRTPTQAGGQATPRP